MDRKPIRILHVIGSMNRGGAETMIMNFYRTIDRERIQFDFVENTFEPAAFDEEILALGGRIFRCPHYNGKNHFQYVKWWKRFFQENKKEYAAVHGHLGSTAAIYLSIAKKAGVYTIAHSHNTNHLSWSGMIYWLYAFPTRFIADYFFGCSMDAGIARYGRRICNSDRFSVLNNAIDVDLFAFSPQIRKKMRCQLDIDHRLVIGHVGRFLPQKNHHFLIQIFVEIHKRNSDTVLLLVGDGPLRSRIEEQVRKAGLEDSVIFAGVQSNTCDYYQAMDVFVFPSIFEGLGIVVVEAQASGLPCIISDRVSRECIVTENLVSVQNLTDSLNKWTEAIWEKKEQARIDHSVEVKENKYDIHDVVKKLQLFYMKIGADRCEKE